MTNPPINLTRVLSSTFIIWFVFLCVLHLAMQRPLWNDELAVFDSIHTFSTKEMFTTNLSRHQVFPRVYLFGIQQFSKIFDFSLWSMRLPSFVCMMLAFVLWIKLARAHFKKDASYFAFLLSWSASIMMVYYAAELKPYSMDLLASICAIWLLMYPRKSIFLYPLFGFVSYPAFLFAFIFVYHLLVKMIRDSSQWKSLFLYTSILTIVVIVSYQFDMQYRNLTSVNTGYHDYFIATDSLGNFFKTFGEGVKDLYINWFVTEPKWIRNIASFFSSFGLVYLFGAFYKNFKKEKYQIASLETIGFGLFLALFLLGIMQKYPYIVPRTVLFFAPIVFFGTIKGIEGVACLNASLSKILLGSYLVFLCGITVFLPRLILTGTRIFQPLF